MQKPAYIEGVYYPGVTVAGAQGALLRWSEGDQLSLVVATNSDEGGSATQELFSVFAGSVARVQSILNQVKITLVTGEVYRFEFRAGVGSYLGSAAGFMDAAAGYKETRFDDWMKEFKRLGVKASRTGYGKLFVITTVATLVGIGAIVAYVFATES